MKNLCGVLATTLLIAACETAAPPAPATPAQVPAPMPYAPLDRVMQAIPFPSSNIIFDTQSNDPEPKVDPKAARAQGTGKKATEDYKSVYGGWMAVENAAIALQETANLITLPGRMCSNGKPVPTEREDYRKFVQGLADAGKMALEVAKTRDLDKMLDVSGTVTEACAACHEVYRDKDDVKDTLHASAGEDRACREVGAKTRDRQEICMSELFLPVRHFAEWINEFPSSIAIRESRYLSPYLTVSHVVVMAFVAGLVLMIDLRLLGVANMRTPFTELQRKLFPWQMFGMVLAAITGLVLAFSDPMRFYVNIFFWLKMLILLLAALNAMAFHYTTYFDVGRWDSATATPFSAKLSGGISVALWALVIISGRLIPYNWFA